jgi:hypothetical protein
MLTEQQVIDLQAVAERPRAILGTKRRAVLVPIIQQGYMTETIVSHDRVSYEVTVAGTKLLDRLGR